MPKQANKIKKLRAAKASKPVTPTTWQQVKVPKSSPKHNTNTSNSSDFGFVIIAIASILFALSFFVGAATQLKK